ncbi:MAG: glycosyltransferase [Bacteroidetes bacterium]|nr:glycosyltransferase [Bacteroidota bacterium]
MNNPFFTIVIPTKNRSFLVNYAIESVLHQTFKDYELIVVDNDDTNDTFEVVSKFNSNKIKYIRTGKLNMSDNWERGILESKGLFITILEDKQALKLHALEEIHSVIQNYNTEVVTWLFDGFHDHEHFINRTYGSGKELVVKTEKILDTIMTESFVYKQLPIPRAINALVSKNIIEKISLKSNGKIITQIAPDYGLGFSILAFADSVVHIDRSLGVLGSPQLGTGASGLKRSELSKAFQNDYIKKYGNGEVFYNSVPIKCSWISFNSIWNDYNNTRALLGGNLTNKPIPKSHYYFTCYKELEILRNNGNDISVESSAFKKAFENELLNIKEELAELLKLNEPTVFPVKFVQDKCNYNNIMEYINDEESKRIKSVYVNENIEVFYGETASDLLTKSNDKDFLTDKGIISVDKNRWLTAQKYEKKTWMERSLGSNDDRNYEHKKRFNNYGSLKNFKFEKVIELGCGPFTNLRVILPEIKSVKSVALLDPLISEYLKHPNCTYKNGNLLGFPVQIINSTIEDFVTKEKYDLVVMNNVLEHCYNIPKIFEVLVSLLNENGIFVFADIAFNAETIKSIVEKQFDAGHPIRLEENYLKDFLVNNFNTIYEKKYLGLYNQPYRHDFYFIGEYKKNINFKTRLVSFPVKKEAQVIHFVYSGDPLNDDVITAPGTITNRVFRYLQKFGEVKYYDLIDKTSKITVSNEDIIIGHPHPEEGTILKRLFEHECAGKYLLWPLHTRIPEINRYVKELAASADKLFVISGHYWMDTIDETEFRYLKDKIIRLDNAVDSKVFSFKKNKFNPVGKRGLFVFGRSGEEKGTKELFKLLLKLECPVIIAGHYSDEDISIIKDRTNTKYIGSISLRDQTVVNNIINTCDFFINMSVSDASPTTLLESMSIGLIPITTPQCGYYYSSFILLSLSDKEHNIFTVNNALNMDEENLRILQKKNRNIIEQYHNWNFFCNKIGNNIFNTHKTSQPFMMNKKGIKVAGEFEKDKSLTQIDSVSEFANGIKKVIKRIKPTKIIETGTFHGTGTTKIIAEALKENGLVNTKFFSIEVNKDNYNEAKKNIEMSSLNDFVSLLNGLSLPREILPSIEEIERSTVKEIEFDNVFVDHKESERAKLYYNETNFTNVDDALLEQCLITFNYEPDFVLLDSGGHIGNLEFNYVIERLNKECIVALDDVNHIKHKKSLMQMKSDSRFQIINLSDEKFGFCIAKFTPTSKYALSVISLKGFQPKNILFIRTDSIGDNVLASSMLEEIKDKFSNSDITVLCQEHIAELYKHSPYVKKIITIDKQRIYVDENYKTEVIVNIRNRKFDLVINSVFSSEEITDLFAITAGAEKIIRIDGNAVNSTQEWVNEARKLSSNSVKTGAGWLSELKRYKIFLAGIGAWLGKLKPEMWLGEDDEKFAEQFFTDNKLDPQKTIVLFAGAQNDHRLYYNYGKALSDICSSNGFSVVAVGSNKDYEINQSNLNDIDASTINLSGKTTILQTAAIIKKCRLAVGAETGNAHIACAVGTPNVIVIGGGHLGRFMPYSNLTSLVAYPMGCFGCNWKCKFPEYKCITHISAGTIKVAVEQSLLSNSENVRIFVQDNNNIKTVTKFLDVDNYEIIVAEENSIWKAEEAIEDKDYQKANEILTRIIEKDPANIEALIDLAVVNSLQENNESAVKLLKTILDIDPGNEIAKNNLEIITKNKMQESVNEF